LKTDKIQALREPFEAAAQEHQNIEFWFARDLQQLLYYAEWRNFTKVIEKAVEGAKNSEQDPTYHFVGVNKMVEIGSGAEREVEDVILTR
jgi:DNA-damage-inducible protein D